MVEDSLPGTGAVTMRLNGKAERSQNGHGLAFLSQVVTRCFSPRFFEETKIGKALAFFPAADLEKRIKGD